MRYRVLSSYKRRFNVVIRLPATVKITYRYKLNIVTCSFINTNFIQNAQIGGVYVHKTIVRLNSYLGDKITHAHVYIFYNTCVVHHEIIIFFFFTLYAINIESCPPTIILQLIINYNYQTGEKPSIINSRSSSNRHYYN